MSHEVELSSLDLRYEGRRMKNRALEGRLLSSMAERGIEEALEGVGAHGVRVLMNGFKRYRCALKLGMATAPYTSLGDDEATGIVALLRISKTKSLSILEQAGFIDELRTLQTLSTAEIAEFVVALSGQPLSVREIEQLAHGFFRGPDSFREQIRGGHIALALERIGQVIDDPEGCSAFERSLLKDLETVGKYIQRVMGKCHDPRLKTRVFHAEANLLSAGILSRSPAFIQTMRSLHDRSGKA